MDRHKINDVSYCMSLCSPENKPLGLANFVQMSWDIETNSHDGNFPNPNDKRNACFQISAFISTQNKEGGERHLLTMHTVPPPSERDDEKNIIVHTYKSESKLLLEFVRLIQRKDPDIMYTYNGDTFDSNYVAARCRLLDCYEEFMSLTSRNPLKPSYVRREAFSSSAAGYMTFVRIYFPGRLIYDLYVHYSRGLRKFETYKLDTVYCRHFSLTSWKSALVSRA